MVYRADIDGLRALAVTLVIVFHAQLGLFSGGFVGVDVFFVISGFLISSIVANDVAAGRFSIGQFYARRARRILPALFVVLFASTIAALFLLILPQNLERFARSARAALLFYSNFFSVASEIISDLRKIRSRYFTHGRLGSRSNFIWSHHSFSRL